MPVQAVKRQSAPVLSSFFRCSYTSWGLMRAMSSSGKFMPLDPGVTGCRGAQKLAPTSLLSSG